MSVLDKVAGLLGERWAKVVEVGMARLGSPYEWGVGETHDGQWEMFFAETGDGRVCLKVGSEDIGLLIQAMLVAAYFAIVPEPDPVPASELN